jgi:hypothetical protein
MCRSGSEVRDEHLEVIAVFHGRQRWPKRL